VPGMIRHELRHLPSRIRRRPSRAAEVSRSSAAGPKGRGTFAHPRSAGSIINCVVEHLGFIVSRIRQLNSRSASRPIRRGAIRPLDRGGVGHTKDPSDKPRGLDEFSCALLALVVEVTDRLGQMPTTVGRLSSRAQVGVAAARTSTVPSLTEEPDRCYGKGCQLAGGAFKPGTLRATLRGKRTSGWSA
jgi:hypothetical protein